MVDGYNYISHMYVEYLMLFVSLYVLSFVLNFVFLSYLFLKLKSSSITNNNTNLKYEEPILDYINWKRLYYKSLTLHNIKSKSKELMKMGSCHF